MTLQDEMERFWKGDGWKPTPGYVQEDLLEARRRTALHCKVKGQVDRDYLVPDAPPFEVDDSPTGAVILWAFLAVSIATVALILVLVLR